jgi:hypothetical protein
MAGKLVTLGRKGPDESVCHMYRLAIKERENADRETTKNQVQYYRLLMATSFDSARPNCN